MREQKETMVVYTRNTARNMRVCFTSDLRCSWIL